MDFYKLAMKAKANLNESANGMNRRFVPCLDNLHIPRHPFDPDAPVISSGIPMIIGNCTSEYSPSANDPTVEDISIEGVKEKLRNGMSSYGKALGEHAGEIVDAYNGRLELGQSDVLGGLKVSVCFPNVSGKES